MRYESFKEFELYYSEYYIQKKYNETLDILNKALEVLSKKEYEENLFTILFDKAKVYMLSEEYNKGLSVLEELVSKGFACPLSWEIFKPLFKDITYLKLKRRNLILRSKLQEKTSFIYEIHLPKDYTKEKKYPVFFNLHGDGDNIELHKRYWKPDRLLEKGFIVVYPQSSEVLFHKGYGWCKRLFNVERIEECKDIDNLYDGRVSRECYDLAHYEMEECYKEISQKYSIDEENIFIGGMSGGATAALEFTMANVIPIKGFITLCPELQPSSFTKESVGIANKRGVKGVFMEGEYADLIDDEVKMMKIFDEVGLPYQSYINKGLGHWYPKDLDDKVDNALKFLNE